MPCHTADKEEKGRRGNLKSYGSGEKKKKPSISEETFITNR
jgi:hypothetical protein